jgi:asparagine synthase (glutamine-hydrolysing)
MRRIAKLMDGAGLDRDERITNYFRWMKHRDTLKLYTPEVRARLLQVEAEAPMLAFMKRLPARVSPLQKMLTLEQRFFLADHNLLYTDKMSMAAGVEVRVPFLDIELVEFSSRIPDNMKQRGKVGKWVLKKAMENMLPHDIVYRPKTGFGVPLRR